MAQQSQLSTSHLPLPYDLPTILTLSPSCHDISLWLVADIALSNSLALRNFSHVLNPIDMSLALLHAHLMRECFVRFPLA